MSNAPAVTLRWTQRVSIAPLVYLAQALAVGAAAVGLLTPRGALFAVACAAAVTWLDYFRSAKEHSGTATLAFEGPAVVIEVDARRWRLLGKDIVGATTALGEHGTDLTLQTRRGTPLTLQDLDEATTQRICETLAIGWAGVGVLAFRDARNLGIPIVFAYVAPQVLAVVYQMQGAFTPWVMPLLLVLWTALLASWNRLRPAPVFTMAGAGMTFATKSGRVGVLWPDFQRVDHGQGELIIGARGQMGPIRLPIRSSGRTNALTPYEADVVTQHVRAAVDRARGHARRRRLDVADELLDQGTRTTADWYAQLDVMATEIGNGAGYRTNQLTLEQVHAVLQNADAAPLARIGAARIVQRLEGERARPRIELVRSTIRGAEYEEALDEALDEPQRALDATASRG